MQTDTDSNASEVHVPRGTPVAQVEGVPAFASGHGPPTALTRGQLAARRLRLAEGQQPVAYIITRYYGDCVPLYDPAAAVRMRPLASVVRQRMAARRTCPRCGHVREHIVRGDRCGVCRIREFRARQRRRERTCGKCGVERQGRQAEEEQRRRERVAERVARERAAREREVAELREWAGKVLADERAVVLDTETTGLHGEARIVEISVITIAGDPLLDTLLDPGVSIPPEATHVHGIGDDDVRDAPRFGDILDRLTDVLADRRVLIYNEPYDVARLRHELTLYHLGSQGQEMGDESGYAAAFAAAAARAKAWLDAMSMEDVMVPYSDWVGDWNDYFANYRWQPLNGGHRALGDCRAVLARLRQMAATGGD